MPKYSIGLIGDKELMAALELANAKSKTATAKVTKNLAERGKQNAKNMAPVDTWFMHDHIRTFHGDNYSEIHSQASYSGFVNFGTRYQTAQPFFTYMVEDLSKWAKTAYIDVARGLLK